MAHITYKKPAGANPPPPHASPQKEQTDHGAPTRPFDEAAATLISALFLALANSRAGDCGFEVAFSRALTSPAEAKTVTDGRAHYAPSAAQRVVARAQRAGLVEGDVLARLGAK